MNDRKDQSNPKTESPPERHDPRERTVAPPIEREHETAAGVFEEEKEHEKERR